MGEAFLRHLVALGWVRLADGSDPYEAYERAVDRDKASGYAYAAKLQAGLFAEEVAAEAARFAREWVRPRLVSDTQGLRAICQEAGLVPVVVAPIVTAPADNRSRIGVLEQTPVENDRHGPGAGGGAGTGSGTGLGAGQGPGIGDGSGGGTGGGPYRPGSGISPPQLLKEVRADYTEDARRQGIKGEVVLEIVVRRDGSVGDVRILQGLGGGLNNQAVDAVRQWRFSPAARHGEPVDVIVEVAVEFKLR